MKEKCNTVVENAKSFVNKHGESILQAGALTFGFVVAYLNYRNRTPENWNAEETDFAEKCVYAFRNCGNEAHWYEYRKDLGGAVVESIPQYTMEDLGKFGEAFINDEEHSTTKDQKINYIFAVGKGN